MRGSSSSQLTSLPYAVSPLPEYHFLLLGGSRLIFVFVGSNKGKV